MAIYFLFSLWFFSFGWDLVQVVLLVVLMATMMTPTVSGCSNGDDMRKILLMDAVQRPPRRTMAATERQWRYEVRYEGRHRHYQCFNRRSTQTYMYGCESC